MTTANKVCQRGVDGSLGCGHRNGIGDHGCCLALDCFHRCDFSPPSPPEVETHEYVPSIAGDDDHNCLYPGCDGQPKDAPIHKVSKAASSSPWRWIVRHKSRVITGGWEESLFYQEENARGFAKDAGKGTTIKKYALVEAEVAPRDNKFDCICSHCGKDFKSLSPGATLCGHCFAIGHRGWTCDHSCKVTPESIAVVAALEASVAKSPAGPPEGHEPPASIGCGPARPDDGSECAYGFCPRPRDGCDLHCVEHHRSICNSPEVVREPPASVWINPRSVATSYRNGSVLRIYNEETKEDQDIKYLAADPIRKALAECRVMDAGTADESTAQVIVRKSDWDALVKSIKGEGDE